MGLTENEINRGLRMSIVDGAFATVMGAVCGGIFLVGFALNVLGASTVQVGVLAALPLSANIAQVLGSVILERFGKRRKLCLLWVTLARLFWIPVILLPLPLFGAWDDARVWALVLLVGLASVHGSLSGVAWLGWMSDLIPPSVRGRFFARRNTISAACGMFATLAGGAFLNFRETRAGRGDATTYMLLFGVGLAFGLVSSFFLSRVPDPRDRVQATGGHGFSWANLVAPLRDANFRSLLFYVAAFMFVTQLAGPFYAVHMIEYLEVDFSTITWLITFATLASLFMLRIWGPISDQLGNKPILLVAGAAHACIPLVWVVARNDLVYQALTLAHVLSGMFFAAITLAHVNVLIKLSPETGRSFYIAAFNTFIGVAVAAAPVMGGALLQVFEGMNLTLGGWHLTGSHMLFLLSGGLQLLVLLLVIRVKETGAAGARAVLFQLRNDLDPQTGIASATDFVTLRVTKTSRVFRRIDIRTNDWAGHCEQRAARYIDLLLRKFRKPVRYLLDLPPSSP